MVSYDYTKDALQLLLFLIVKTSQQLGSEMGYNIVLHNEEVCTPAYWLNLKEINKIYRPDSVSYTHLLQRFFNKGILYGKR